MEYRRYAWGEIDLGAVAHNVRTLKGRLAPRTKLMAVVKANGYGHGAVEVARTALASGAERLGVATMDEALELRAAGISVPVHVLSEPPASAAELVVEHALIPALYSLEFATALSRAAVARQSGALYHLKVDTGMNRVGVRAEAAYELLQSISNLPGITMEGVFTHFATADVPGDWDFETQVERFDRMLERFRDERVDTGIVHAANSPATILHPSVHYDMVRPGIAIYGLHPAPATHGAVALRPAMSIKARLSYVKRIGMGDGVSYGHIYRASGPTTIATLPLGYADGVHRVLSERMDVIIGGRRCRQVGRICMDQLMVEVPNGVPASVGDEATLVGSQGSETIALDELASAAGTINYEMACAFGLRLGRVYT